MHYIVKSAIGGFALGLAAVAAPMLRTLFTRPEYIVYHMQHKRGT